MWWRKKAAGGLLALSVLVFAAPADASGRSVDLGEAGVKSMSGLERGRSRRDEIEWSRRVQYDGGLYRQPDRRAAMLSPPEVRRILRANGFRQIQYLDRRGRIYQVQATDSRGQRVGLVVSARSGAVLTSYRLN